MRTCLPLTRHFADAHLGWVSVVMMARANSSKAPAEETRICEGSKRPNSLATFSVVAAAAPKPSEPVQQFALPEFTITPRMRLLDFRRFNCEAITGAALTRLVVKTAAADAGVSLTRIARSSLVFFKPQWVAAKVNPRGRSEFVRRMGIVS